jgi:ribonuclease HII
MASSSSTPPKGPASAGGQVPRLRRALRSSSPGLDHERRLWASGHEVVVGIDEVGRGAWAGPLTLVAAVVPRDRRVYKIRDSKMLTEAEREAMFDRVADWCEYWAVGEASHTECDELGMSAAQRLAAQRAIDGLGVAVDHVLLDGKWDFVGGGATTMIVKGDASCLSIAAASILAKVTRDRFMREMAAEYDGYVFEENKGYPCPRHRAALAERGPCALHRQSWAFMDSIDLPGVERYIPERMVDVDPQGALFD